MAMNTFFRVVGPTLTPPILTSIKPRHMVSGSDIGPSQRPSPAKFTPPSTLLRSMRVTRVEQSPYKVAGPELPVSIWEPESGDGLVRVRVDMPGVNKVDVETNHDEKCVNFKGFEEEITMHGIGKGGQVCRVYQGCLEFDPVRFPQIDFTYELKNGVLSFKIQSVRPGVGGDIGVTLKANQVEAEFDITKESAINPLVSQGLDRYHIHGFNDKTFVFAVDMPGIGERDTLSLNVVRETLNYFAQDKSPASYGESMNEDRREYEGYLRVNSQEFEPNEAQFEVIHGVFWIILGRRIKAPIEMITLYHGSQEEKIYDYNT